MITRLQQEQMDNLLKKLISTLEDFDSPNKLIALQAKKKAESLKKQILTLQKSLERSDAEE